MISYNKALKILYKSRLKIKSEKILLKNAMYRICSENIYSKSNYPTANNTALDGFALNSKETTKACLLYTSPSPRDGLLSRMPSSA